MSLIHSNDFPNSLLHKQNQCREKKKSKENWKKRDKYFSFNCRKGVEIFNGQGQNTPPRSPKMGCYVERANETYRYKFWHVYEIPDTIEETRKLLRKFEYKYNCERMHQSLNYLTPMEYYYKLKDKSA